ncbi:MAG: LacI family DNA-binding transcriptional regulator [Armatimonadetes bacterium]|nr:LacI family DNA-binding transcriptional regulator [Armatimonadota bacterium]
MGTKRNQNRATLQAVADKAGVSVTTASLVLSGKHEIRRISENAQGRVLKAAAELNYAPNMLVRSLRKGRSHIISFYNGFRHRKSSDLYMDKLATSIEYAGGSHGYDVLVQCNYQRSNQESYEFLNGGMADGVLMFAPDTKDPLMELLRRSDLPVVLLNTRDHAGMFPSVADDNDTGLKILAKTLVDLGHSNIAAFSSEGSDIRDAETRVRNLGKWLAKRGIKELMVCEHVHAEAIDEVLQKLLGQPTPPTALFCWHDKLAYSVLDACERIGVSVPSQLSVIGYDGIRWPARSGHVAASIHVDLEILAEMGVRILDRYVSGYDGPLIEETLPISLSPGTTLGPTPVLLKGETS